MAEIKFKSYCWSIGTTSYRTSQMNLSIEWQVKLMNEFRQLEENIGICWRELQSNYYYFLHEKSFLIGNASRPDKDAREKTSGLVDLGLFNAERNLTDAGQALLKLCVENDFARDNFLEIPKDSYLYLKQLLKTSISVGENTVRPFIILAYLLSKFGFLSKTEFVYFLPMCIDEKSTNRVVESIALYRKNKLDVLSALYDVIKEMDNYKEALKIFLSTNTITPELICTIGFNRKSAGEGKAYDTVFYIIYNCLQDIYINKIDKSLELFNAINNIKGNTRLMWKKLLFGKNQLSNVKKNGVGAVVENCFSMCKDLCGLKEIFFKVMHSFKVQATLSDYADLNKRYFKLSDCVLFRDNKVEFDIVPKAFFNLVASDLYTNAFERCEDLHNNVELSTISPSFENAKTMLYNELTTELGVSINNGDEARQYVYDERYERFNALVESKFNNESLITLIENFENRADKKINEYITDNADIPTLFEYVLGIAWYKISQQQGDILSYMNLSLDADLLPKTHAGGGMADIVYKYEECSYYPKHTLLIEATLSEKVGQRSMEYEPVTRHLAEYKSKNTEEAYSVFIPTYLNPNLAIDFRAKKDIPYIATNGECVNGLKIIPLQTSELKTAIVNNISYIKLYQLFDKAHKSDTNIVNWYKNEVEECIN